MNRDIMAWLGYTVVSPLAVLALVAFLLGACAPVDLCPDLRCEYGYGEAQTEAPAPDKGEKGDDRGDKGDKGHGKDKGDKGHDKGGKGKGHDKGDRDGDDD